MEDSRDGFRKFLEIQVEGLQEQLYSLERDPSEVEHLKSILRISQRVRHAQEPDEPQQVRILRNAVEKVTLHLGRADLAVTQDILDFYVDSFDLLEEAVRRWPAGPSFDRARYADRVRGLLDTTAPRRGATPAPESADRGWSAGDDLGTASTLADAAPADGQRGMISSEATAVDGPGRIEPEPWSPGPGEGSGVRTAVAIEAGSIAEDVPTWKEGTAEVRIEVQAETGLSDAELAGADPIPLEDLLSEPWRGPRGRLDQPPSRETEGPVQPPLTLDDGPPLEVAAGGSVQGLDLLPVGELDVDGIAEGASPAAVEDLRLERPPGAGGLAASYATYESLRAGRSVAGAGRDAEGGGFFAPRAAGAHAALSRLRDDLDAFAVALHELERDCDDLLRNDGDSLGTGTLGVLVERLELEKGKLLDVFDRSIIALREGDA
ncbi:MAG: hypothetical protein H0V09_05275 [Gemmatimonadetes bacterium]|nr:hypothetical protein [Gemmatimonadota bacterium]